MIKDNIKAIEAEIGKIANVKITDVRQAERLGCLYNAQECLMNLLDANKGKEQISANNRVVGELNDILPALKEYERAKEDFKQHKITQGGINHYLRRFVVEINEFITVLYSNTTAPEEREILKGIKSLF